MKHPKPDASTEEILSLMFEMGRMLKAAVARDLAPFSMLHFETLRFIQERGDPAMREVAEYLKISAPTATDIIDSLVRGGHLRRSLDAEDRRKVRLVLSPKGKRALSDSLKKRLDAFAAVVAPLGAAERRAFVRILRVITSAS